MSFRSLSCFMIQICVCFRVQIDGQALSFGRTIVLCLFFSVVVFTSNAIFAQSGFFCCRFFFTVFTLTETSKACSSLDHTLGSFVTSSMNHRCTLRAHYGHSWIGSPLFQVFSICG